MMMFTLHLMLRCAAMQIGDKCKIGALHTLGRGADNKCWRHLPHENNQRKLYFGHLEAPCKFVQKSEEKKQAWWNHNGVSLEDQIGNQQLLQVAANLANGAIPEDALRIEVAWDVTSKKWF